ncbi:MAG: helix-turn-helix domain-containing protein, partial [Muribaculaceae bacterium]|nr:helix-turn-helix domain-containing protein [Muribaculaceae bacterium]
PHHPSGILYAMVPVGRELWVSTGDGVHAIDRLTGRSRLLPLPPLTYTSIYYDRLTSTVLLGSTDAIVRVDPLRLSSRRKAPAVSIVGAFIGDKPLPFPPSASSVKLPYGAGALTLELATFDYSPDAFERFAYRCSPDTVWTLLPPRDNRLVLSGLPAGLHTLELRLGDDPSSLRTLTVDVLPPWYLSTGWRIVWAVLMLALGSGAFLIARSRNIRNLRRIERRNALAKAEERLNFITNISHDLKTPLSMIIGPLSRVRDGSAASPDEKARAVDTAFDNAIRLHRLLAHTLEAGTLDATTDSAAITRPTDISALVRSLAENCASAYPECTFSISIPSGEAVIADVDAGKFESVVSNLLSNAIKYSEPGAAEISVDLTSDTARGIFRLSVADKGIGIVPDRIPHIFERKYRTPRGADFSEGSGIGLFLVKHFVELHGGSVEVESTPGEGSVFTVEMPLKAASGILEPSPAPSSRAAIPVPDPSRRRVLIVDDNDEVLTFIGTILEPSFQCAFASDGARALEIAPVFRPDLIITDEKMPGMSGLEMVRALKSAPATASISIILLTAMASNELETRSIAAGVDLFMSKPFDPAMLRARAESILRRKAEIRRAARIEEITAAAPPSPDEEVSDRERALARIADVVERNLASATLSVAFVCEQTGLQPKQLYRLMKKYVGLTPVEYIRNVRLERAAALLAKGDLTVSEVMYRVGFNSPSYFSKCFRARFGTAPAEYK